MTKLILLISLWSVEHRFEMTTDPVFTARKPVNLSVGVRAGKHISSLEYSAFDETTGNETFYIERRFEHLLAWYRNVLFEKNSYRLTVGFGAGAYQEDLTTSFYGSKTQTASGPKWAAATAVGLEYDLAQSVAMAFEGRLLAGQNLEPNPNPSFLARVLFQF